VLLLVWRHRRRQRQVGASVAPYDGLSDKLGAGPVGRLRPGRLTMQYSDGDSDGGGERSGDGGGAAGPAGQGLLGAAASKPGQGGGGGGSAAQVHVFTDAEMAATSAELAAAEMHLRAALAQQGDPQAAALLLGADGGSPAGPAYHSAAAMAAAALAAGQALYPHLGGGADGEGAAEAQAAALAAAAALASGQQHLHAGLGGAAGQSGAEGGPADAYRRLLSSGQQQGLREHAAAVGGGAAGAQAPPPATNPLFSQHSLEEYEAAAAAAAAAVLHSAAQRHSMSLAGGQAGGQAGGGGHAARAGVATAEGGAQAGGEGGAGRSAAGVQAGGEDAALAALAAELRRQEGLLRGELAELQDGQGWVREFRAEVWPQLHALLHQVQSQQAALLAEVKLVGRASQQHAAAAAAQRHPPPPPSQGYPSPAQLAAQGGAPGLGQQSRYDTPSGLPFASAPTSFTAPPRGPAPHTSHWSAAAALAPPYEGGDGGSEGSELSTPAGSQHGTPHGSLLPPRHAGRQAGGAPPAPPGHRLRPAAPPALLPAYPPPPASAGPSRLAAYRGAEFGAAERAAAPLDAMAAPRRPRPLLHGAADDDAPFNALFDDGGDDALGTFEADALRQQLQQLHLAAGLLQTLDPSQLAAAVSAGAQAQMARRGRRPEPPRWIENPAARESVVASMGARDSMLARSSVASVPAGDQPPPRRLMRRMSSVIRRLLSPQPSM
jgi:SWI/SNF-related matrix-associated actin-dependent regulator 1 of chromatin subfamily A